MTGTSIDALDVAAVRIEGRALDLRADIAAFVTHPLDDLAPRLRACADGHPLTAAAAAALALDLGERHARACRELAQRAGPPDLIALHGQTVFHSPPRSWQLLNPWPVARDLRAVIVYDLRAADLAAGGQGAPITPIADWIIHRAEHESRAIVNLGGFCNITHLPRAGAAEDIRAADVCACNQVLDACARAALDAPYDDGGATALAAEPHPRARDDLRALLDAQRTARRALGSGDEAHAWAQRWSADTPPGPLLAAVCDALARTIAAALDAPDRVLLAGGGVRNRALVRALERHCTASVETTDANNVPPEQREAMSIAVLGALCADRTPITLPRVTGRAEHAPLDGAWILPHAADPMPTTTHPSSAP
ncbi:MAG: hypothetical protein EA379_01025 [Phycisphaerales bacterium]|nr:MAG: hypothetical protein EA379_01025 [Phycisphaerales bacterium]